jgi:hypothetical protein
MFIMKTETSFDASSLHLNNDNGKENCNHPILHPSLTKSGFHTGFYICVKCSKLIKDIKGTMLVKELFF